MLEKTNEKMIKEITNLVNEVKDNIAKKINKSIYHFTWSWCILFK